MISDEDLLKRFNKAVEARGKSWETHWADCYEYTLPHRDISSAYRRGTPGSKRNIDIFDGTAPDAVDQLAASMLGQLTPPWAQWFGLTAAELVDAVGEDPEEIKKSIESIARIVQTHFDLSNFQVEIHQCYLDLVIAGTASLQFELAPDGSPSSFWFSAIPPFELCLEESGRGLLDTTFRRYEWPLSKIVDRFPEATLPESWGDPATAGQERLFAILEAVLPDGKGRYDYRVLALGQSGASAGAGSPGVGAGSVDGTLRAGTMDHSPFINFRWLKASGEVYGRSPVMKILPDIKTANKVVELVLKNASFAVTGMWQADDDGVINPANIKLIPGTIIPKAVGSAGLTPLQAPGRFDVSALILEGLQSRIRHALMVDRLAEIDANARMTATEVLERTAEMARVLGATYGRLQTELLNPLISRATYLLARVGEIPEIRLDGRVVKAQYLSPLAKAQALQEARNIRLWLEAVTALGPEYSVNVNKRKAVTWLQSTLGVPAELIASEDDIEREQQDAAVNETSRMATGAVLQSIGKGQAA